jgi:DNA-binding XRE family transcriptional regulator
MSELLVDRIRKARIRYGMSQAELARRIKVSLNTMNKIEAGETPDPRASRCGGPIRVCHAGYPQELYARSGHKWRHVLPGGPLLYVPTHPARTLDADLVRAGIPKKVV